MDDLRLLRAYVDDADEAAFTELVSRHTSLVYRSALRQVREAHLAEDVAQAVFTILARKAHTLGAGVVLAGWLYRTTRFVAANAVKREMRRRRHEERAADMAGSAETHDREWSAVAPVLDEAMNSLGRKDRDATLLRYFEGKSYGDVAAALGTSEGGARMRVTRALEKLRRLLTKRGVAPSVAVLGTVLASRGAEAAPQTLAATCATTALAAKGELATGTALLVKGALEMMFWSKVKTAAAVALCGLVLVGTGVALGAGGGDVRKYPPPPPKDIPVRFTLRRPGYVTLVIEDGRGGRVRNLIQDTYFPAGTHTVYWDGYNEMNRYRHIPVEPGSRKKDKGYDIWHGRVEPGTYNVRGLVHDDIELTYEMPIQSPGNPPWHTADRTGAWLADHTPPQDALFLPDGSPHGSQPQVLFSASIAECGHSMMWLDANGKKIYGSKLQGWEGAMALARDAGERPFARYYAYAVGARKGKMTLYGLSSAPRGDEAYGSYVRLKWYAAKGYNRDVGAKIGLVARDGIVAFSRPLEGRVVFVDPKPKKPREIRSVAVDDPRGMAIDGSGRLFVITGTRVRRFDAPDLARGELGSGTDLVTAGLEDPQKIVLDRDGGIYVSDWGASHQVKVFDARGRLVRRIGRPGGPAIGSYEEQRMHSPAGMALDGDGRLWVAEIDYAPKRVSVWDARTGRFVKGLYGPPRYGGGGRLDPRDRTRFFYAGNYQGIEFALDWTRGTSKPVSIYALRGHTHGRVPSCPVYVEGRRYMINSFDGPHRFLAPASEVFLYEDGVVARVAGIGTVGKKGLQFGDAGESDPALKAKLATVAGAKDGFAIWSDTNRDGIPQADEVHVKTLGGKRPPSGVKINEDLSITTTTGVYIPPPSINERGVPAWDMDALTFYGDRSRHLSDVVRARDGTTILLGGHYGGPIHAYRGGNVAWTYHCRAGKMSPPEATGEVTHPSRTLGYTFRPRSGDAGELWALNGDRGSIYVFTTDGLYVTDLSADRRTNPMLRLPEARAGRTVVDDLSFNDEHFWPSINQVADGTIYLVAGKEFSAAFEVTGLGTVRRITGHPVAISPETLAGRPDEWVQPAVTESRKSLRVAMTDQPPRVDGRLDDWQRADWVVIDERRDISAALAVSGRTLYAAFLTRDERVLNNTASDGWQYLFATGGGLDFMFRTRADAKTVNGGKWKGNRFDLASSGDVRLFVTRIGDPVRGTPRAVRFQQLGGGGGEKVTYTSPIGTAAFESVKDVSDDVRLAQGAGVYELSVPLDVVGLSARAGESTIGDVGVLLGDGGETQVRLYWNNRAAGIVSDIPSEAKLQPAEWGTFHFVPASEIEPVKRRGPDGDAR